jgi:hypothetical protein
MRTLLVSLFVAPFLMTSPLQSPASGVYPIMRSEKNPAPDLQEVVTPWSRQFVSLGPALIIDHFELHSNNNANSLYNAVVSYSSDWCGGAVLRLDEVWIGTNGSSGGTPDCKLSFLLTRAQATRAEALFKVKRQNRHEIGEKLHATFSVSPKLEFVVRIENPPHATAVRWIRGGSQRGPRDNQFSMRITRNGKPLPEIDAPSMGGVFALQLLKPGDSVELRAPISSWGDISRTGHYVVQGAFSTELFDAATETPHGLGHSDQWDRRFQGTVTFEVR